MEQRSTVVPVKLPNHTTINIEVSKTGREDVARGKFPFEDITKTLDGVLQALGETLARARPTKASVKFGVEIAVESGKLTAAIVKGSTKGNLEIALEWSKGEGKTAP